MGPWQTLDSFWTHGALAVQALLDRVILEYAAAMDGHGPGIDTTGRSAAEVVHLIPEWRHDMGSADPPPTLSHTPGRILWLCGPTAVGKSTVGFSVYGQANSRGIHTAFVDLDQIGFTRPSEDPANHRLKAANLAALWPAFRAAGAEQLVVVGPVKHADEVAIYTKALPAATFTLCRLHADRATLGERVRQRGRGQGPPIAGDDLVGQPDTVLQRVADAAASDVDGIADLHIDTNGRSVEDLAEEILVRARRG
jgi:hypothetical protein